MRRVAPYLMAVVGAIAITIAIGLVSARFPIPGLSSLYLLLVLWLGARYGIRPAVVGSLAAFLLYDYFFVPPVGTLTVSGPRELLELILLLAVALVTGQLAASLHRTQSSAETLALESRALYDLVTAALRLSDVTTALALVCERAMQLASVETRRTVTVEGRAVKLTPTEYELLRYLALHVGKPVTHTTLLRWVWGEYAVGDKYNTRYVVAQIRKELGDDPSNPKYIVNEPGVGYRLQA